MNVTLETIKSTTWATVRPTEGRRITIARHDVLRAEGVVARYDIRGVGPGGLPGFECNGASDVLAREHCDHVAGDPALGADIWAAIKARLG